jgi:hypothetical protein
MVCAQQHAHPRLHPNGNIAEFLAGAGLAKVIDVSETVCPTELIRSGMPVSSLRTAALTVFVPPSALLRRSAPVSGRDTVRPRQELLPRRRAHRTPRARRSRPLSPASGALTRCRSLPRAMRAERSVACSSLRSVARAAATQRTHTGLERPRS